MTYKASRHDYQIGEQKDKIAQIEILCDEVIKQKDNNFIADEIETLKQEASNTVDLITVRMFFPKGNLETKQYNAAQSRSTESRANEED